MARHDNQGLLSQLPIDRLRDEAIDLGKAFAKHGLDSVVGRLDSVTDRLGDAAPGAGDIAKGAGEMVSHPVKGGADLVKGGTKAAASKVKDSVGGAVDAMTPGSSSNGSKGLKVTNIVESVDVPVPRDVAYEQWTQFEEFPSFMKKVESVKQEEDDVVTWKAQIFWSHRTWKSTIIDQVPPERIVWKSEAEKGKVDGAVTFHELAPDLTRVLVSLEYHPQGLFEHTGNLWRAQGRRVRLELKHFRRHVANSTLLNPDEVDGWQGEIHDGDVDESPRKSRARKGSSSSPTKKSSARKTTSSGSSPAKKSTARKGSSSSTTRKSPAKKSTAKKGSSSSTTRKSPAKKSTASKTTSRSRKTAAKAASRKS